jgi:hypothetical protein
MGGGTGYRMLNGERSVMRKTDVSAWGTRTGAAFIVPRTRLPSPYSNDIWHPIGGGTPMAWIIEVAVVRTVPGIIRRRSLLI